MGSGVCSRRCAMRAVAGEFGDEAKAAACFNGVPTRAVHVVLARSACSRRALSESASTDDLSQRYGQPYAQRGHVCVWCMVLCIALCAPGGRRVRYITCRDGRPLQGPKKVDSQYTNFSFAFLAICSRNGSAAVRCAGPVAAAFSTQSTNTSHDHARQELSPIFVCHDNSSSFQHSSFQVRVQRKRKRDFSVL